MTPLDLTIMSFVGALGSGALRATAVLAAAAIITMALRRRSAALRHLVWTVGLGATLATLVLPAILPAWRVMPAPAVSWRVATVDAHATTNPVETPSPQTARDALVPAAFTVPPAASASAMGQRSDAPPPILAASSGAFVVTVPGRWPAIVLTLWIAGVLMVAGRYGWSHVALGRLRRRARVLDATDVGAIGQGIAGEMRITRPVSLLISDEVELPLTWGVCRPRVVLPGDASEWSTARIRHVLQHELAHVRRFDACTQVIAQAASAVFWFHPLAWFAGRQMRHERERACDDWVLAQGALASDYAGDLLSLVQSCAHVDRHAVALAMARRSQFEGRLLALLDPRVERGVPSARHVALVFAAAIAIVVPAAAVRGAEGPSPLMAPIRPVITPPLPQGNAEGAPSAGGSGVSPTASPVTRPVTRAAENRPQPRTAPPLEDLFVSCGSRTTNHSSHNFDSDGNKTIWTASARNGDCGFDLRSEGHVEFTPDLTSIARISDGGYFDVTVNLHGTVTHLIERGAGSTWMGAVTGAELTPDATWLPRFLLTLDRHTAFGIDERFPRLRQDGGAAGLLDEIGRMYTDHAKGMYLLRLVNTVPLDAIALRRTFEAAGSMSGEYPAADVLEAASRHSGMSDAAVRAMFLHAALGLRTDHDLARVIDAFLATDLPTPDQSAAILTSAAKMTTDYAKCRVLVALARTPLEGSLRDQYLGVAATLRAEYERTRALSALRRR